MLVTILEGQVPPEKWGALEEAFRAAKPPAQMVESMLLQSAADRNLWRGLSVWHSREALDEYRRSVETPEGITMFRSVGAEPALSIFEVAVHSAGSALPDAAH